VEGVRRDGHLERNKGQSYHWEGVHFRKGLKFHVGKGEEQHRVRKRTMRTLKSAEDKGRKSHCS